MPSGPPLDEVRQVPYAHLPLRNPLPLVRHLPASADVHFRAFRIKRAVEVFAKKQALLHVDPVTFAPRRPAHVIGRIRPDHMGQKDGDRRAAKQAPGRLEPMGGVIARRPLVERSLELVLEAAEGETAPVEQAVTLAFRPAEQFDIEHSRVRLKGSVNSMVAVAGWRPTPSQVELAPAKSI